MISPRTNAIIDNIDCAFNIDCALNIDLAFLVFALRGNFFQCHVFAMKSVQNLKSLWRSSQNYFVLALFSSL